MKKSENIVSLIKSLSKSEKRYFKLFVAKNSKGEKNYYKKLFDLIEKSGSAEKQAIQEFCSDEELTGKQFKIHKHRLYDQILNSLAAYHTKTSIDDEILESIRKAKILYDKGLFAHAESMLEKAKGIASKYEKYALLLEIIRWHKQIMNTSSFYHENLNEEFIHQMSEEENLTINKLANTNDIWKIRSLIFLSFRTNGIARVQQDIEKYNNLIKNPIFKNEELASSYRAKVFYYSLHTNYFNITNNKEKAYQAAKKMVSIMEENPHQIEYEPANYCIALHNLLFTSIALKKYTESFSLVPLLKSIIRKHQLHSSHLFRCYNTVFAEYVYIGQYQKAMQLLPEIDSILKEKKNYDELLNIYFTINKILLYFGNKNYHQSIANINLLLNNKNYLREDLYCFAKMFQLIVHFDKENYDFLPHLIKSVYRYLLYQDKLYQFERIIIQFIRMKLPGINSKKEQTEAFKSLRKELIAISNDPLEARFLELFDIVSWLESKIENRPFDEILREKSGYTLEEEIEQ